MVIVDPAENPVSENPISLNPEILQALGQDIAPSKLEGEALHLGVVEAWESIFLSGIPTEQKKALLDKYPRLTNMPFLDPPKLNPEVKLAVTDAVVAKDDRLVRFQVQLSSAISALGQIVNLSLGKKEGERDLSILEKANDAAKLLLDLQHGYISSRRAIVSVNLNKELKETLLNMKSDEWLFGNDLLNRITVAKNIERSSLSLRQKPKPKPIPSKSLNSKGPPRPQFRAAGQGGLNPPKQQRAAPSNFPNATRQRSSKTNFQPYPQRKRF